MAGIEAGGGIGETAGSEVGTTAGDAVGAAARGDVAEAMIGPTVGTDDTAKPGGGVVNAAADAAGAAMLAGGQPGMFGALTFGGRRAEMPLRTVTIWFICCCCMVSCCCSSFTISSMADEATGAWPETPTVGVVIGSVAAPIGTATAGVGAAPRAVGPATKLVDVATAVVNMVAGAVDIAAAVPKAATEVVGPATERVGTMPPPGGNRKLYSMGAAAQNGTRRLAPPRGLVGSSPIGGVARRIHKVEEVDMMIFIEVEGKSSVEANDKIAVHAQSFRESRFN